MRYLIALLALAGLIDSALALRIHFQDPNAAPPCAVTERWDCGTVNHSRFSEFPPRAFDEVPGSKGVHIPVAILGIVGYALIAVLALANQMWATLQAAEIGFAFAAFLTFMEAYVIEKWCKYCLWSQAIIAVILLCTIVTLALEHRKKLRLRQSALHAS
ncbi:MAG: vitamin K epoxide reductase family protein [Janthinobacterium lividum]